MYTKYLLQARAITEKRTCWCHHRSSLGRQHIPLGHSDLHFTVGYLLQPFEMLVLCAVIVFEALHVLLLKAVLSAQAILYSALD